MSIKIMSAIWEHGPSDQSERFVLIALADNANDDGECWPSVALIARKTCMAERSVRRILKRLCDGGWLNIVPGGGRKNCNRYRIETVTEGQPYSSKTLTLSPQNPDPESLNPDPGSAEPSRTIIEPSIGSALDDKNTKTGRAGRGDDGPHSGASRKPRSLPPKEAAPCKAAQALQAWNDLAARHGLPVANKLTDTRKKALQRRVKDAGGIDQFTAIIRTIPQSPFLVGSNDRKWKASIDFIARQSSFEKLRDGAYHDGKPPTAKPQWTPEQIEAMRANGERLKAYEVWK